jgi:hypothetical protein
MPEYEKEGALSHHAKPKHEGGKHEGGGREHEGGKHPHVHFHKHDGGVTAHVMHHDGGHEIHHFHPDDHEGMADLLQEHMGGMAPGAGGEPPTGEPPEHLAEGATAGEEREEQAA